MNHNREVLPGNICEICKVRNGEKCKDCVYYGKKCEAYKTRFHVSKPMDRFMVSPEVANTINKAKTNFSKEVKKNGNFKEERGEER